MNDTLLADHPAAEPVSIDAGNEGGERNSAPLAGSTAIIVLGMHRSGTSAVAGLLHHLGVALGARLLAPSPDAPLGYWEHKDAYQADHDLMAALGYPWDDLRPLPAGFERSEPARRTARDLAAVLTRDFAGVPLWGIKDPRLCRLMPLWSELLAQSRVSPKFVLALRHPADVAASMTARDGLADARGQLLWLRHVLEAERGSRGMPRTIVHYEELVGDPGWRAVAARMTDELRIAWPRRGAAVEAPIDAFLKPELRRNRISDLAPGGAAAPLQFWIEAVYAAFRAGDEARLVQVCDAVSRELDDAGALFLPIIGELGQSVGQLRVQQLVQERALADLAQQLTRGRYEADELRGAAERANNELTMLKLGHVTMAGRHLPQPLAVEDAYPRWIASRASTAPARPDWVGERVAQWPFVPTLALGMILPSGNELRVALTLRSLLTQMRGDWVLHVAAEGEMPEPFAAEPRLVWHRLAGTPVEWLNRWLLDTDAHWIALIDAGDQLAPHALFSVADGFFHHPEWLALYSDEDRIDLQDARSSPHFKPDFNLDLMRSLPYVGGLLAVRREAFAQAGGFDPRWDGTEEYDLALRLAERLGPAGFGHVADILYHRLTISGRSTRPIAQICADMPKIVQAHLDRLGIPATTEQGEQAHTCRVRYRHDGPEPMVSIVIPTKNQLGLLKRCVEAVLQKTEYENYEVIVVDNGSDEPDACAYLQNIEDRYAEIGSRIRVLRHPGGFNFSAMNNRAVRDSAQGEYICLLNNDAAPLDGAWLGEMMAQARRPQVGAVGAKLFYPDGRIQHGGVILGVGWGSPADHPYIRDPGTSFGYWGRLQVAQDFTVVTAACMVTRRSVYEAVGGLDEEAFAVAYNDVDYCLKVRRAGHLVVWTPYARLLHEASASLRADVEAAAVEEKNARFGRERLEMFRRWMPRIAYDPAYNRNLSSFGFGFAVETEGAPTWDPDFRPRERILVYPADREGCGEYRIIAPSRALLKSGVAHSYETMRLLTPPEVARMAPDSIVFQRQLELGQIDVIERVKNTSPTFRVFELDDLITNLPPKSPHRANIVPDIAERLEKALALCQRLVVSTEPLAKAYGRLCDETVVLPNRLENDRWLGLEPGRRLDGKPRVGWAGGIGHAGDLAMIAGIVEATAKEVDWVFFGMCPDALRPLVAEYHDFVPLRDYARRLSRLDLDLAVAPLEAHPFNEAKSNLRLLEYGVLGYPVLCSNIVPYQGDLPVFRVANRPRAWIKAIRQLVADRDACRRAGEALRAAVLKDWMLDDHLDDLRRAWLP